VTTTNATPKPSTSTDIPAGDKHLADEKDKGSLSTSAGTRTNFGFKRNKYSSEGALSASDATATSPTRLEKSPKSQAKQSFLNKLVRVLIPCVAQSSRIHDIDLPDGAQPTVPIPAVKEKQGAGGSVREPSSLTQNGRTTEPAQSSNQTSEPSTSSLSTPPQPTPRSDTVPQPPEDVTQADLATDNDLTVTSTPSKTLLPVADPEGVTSGAVQPPGSRGDDVVHTQEDDVDEINALDDMEDEEERLIMNGGVGIPIGPDGEPRPLLPPLAPQHAGRKCLVLDLDETLLHSSFKSIQHADYVVPVEIEYHWHNVYVIKRPGVDNFLKKMGELYEIVVFTASLSKYADPVLDKLDIHRVVSHRLFRESCYNHKGNYVKDLSQLGRPMSDTIILDNSPASYIFHPNNAVPVSSWFNDPHDTELTDLCPFLADLRTVDDVRAVLDGGL